MQYLNDERYAATEDTLGGRILRAREAADLSVADAARRLGVLTSTWNTWERDRDVPRANRLTTMAGILGVSPSWVLSGTGPGPVELDASVEDRLLAAFRQTSSEVAALNRRLQDMALGLEKLGSQTPQGANAAA